MVAKLGLQAGKHNVSFISHFLLGDLERCLEILLNLPTQWDQQGGGDVEGAVRQGQREGWQSLADTKDYANLFPDYKASLQAQQMLAKKKTKFIPT